MTKFSLSSFPLTSFICLCVRHKLTNFSLTRSLVQKLAWPAFQWTKICSHSQRNFKHSIQITLPEDSRISRGFQDFYNKLSFSITFKKLFLCFHNKVEVSQEITAVMSWIFLGFHTVLVKCQWCMTTFRVYRAMIGQCELQGWVDYCTNIL